MPRYECRKMGEQRSGNALLCCSFNQDNSCFSVGTREGYKIFHCNSGSLCYQNFDGAVSIIEMLFSSSLIAVVGSGEQPTLSPRRLCMFNTASGHANAELSFVTSVLAVRMNQKRLVVVLCHKVCIYDLANMTLLETIETVPNTRGLCALSTNEENCFLVLPASNVTGSTIIYNALNLQTYCQIQAHQSPLAAMGLSCDGLLLATASEHGTVIRVHKIVEAEKAFTFRRGSYPATIYSLSFGPVSQVPQVLAATSSSGTIHVFKLDPTKRHRNAAGMLTAVTNSMSSSADSDHFHLILRNVLPAGVKSICAIASHVGEVAEGSSSDAKWFNSHRSSLYSVTMNGYFNKYYLNVGPGKEVSWTLEHESAIFTSCSDQISASFV